MKTWIKRIFTLFLIAALLGCGVLAYAYFVEPAKLEVTSITVPIEEWAGTERKMKIVVAGDFHLRPNEYGRMQKTIDAIIDQNPDVILLMGDYYAGHVEGDSMSAEDMATGLIQLTSRAPVYAIIGNHETYHGASTLINAFKEVGITFLERKSVNFSSNDAVIQLVGVPDASVRVVRPQDIPERASADMPMIAITHSPDAITAIRDDVTLTIAAHTHGGQICLPGETPLYVPMKLGTEYAYGDLRYQGKHMIVTKGLGSSIVPFRLCCPPEIMVLNLEGK